MVGAVAGRPVAVAVEPVIAWQKPIERGQQVVLGTSTDFGDHQPCGRVRREDRQQAVAAISCLGDESGALAGDVDETPGRPGPDRQLARLYGKMLRIASRSRPSPPPAGADS
jgi:hypothetical protein